MGSELGEVLQCWSFVVRRTERVVSRRYNDAMRDAPVRASQLTVLAALEARGPISIGDLADTLGLDPTTLTRNLKVLADRGLVSVEHGEDKRTRLVEVTKAGISAGREALPSWRDAQGAMEAIVGGEVGDLRQLARLILAELDTDD